MLECFWGQYNIFTHCNRVILDKELASCLQYINSTTYIHTYTWAFKNILIVAIVRGSIFFLWGIFRWMTTDNNCKHFQLVPCMFVWTFSGLSTTQLQSDLADHSLRGYIYAAYTVNSGFCSMHTSHGGESVLVLGWVCFHKAVLRGP